MKKIADKRQFSLGTNFLGTMYFLHALTLTRKKWHKHKVIVHLKTWYL